MKCFPLSNQGFHGDFCDRLVSIYTPLVFIIMAASVSIYCFVGSPISCLCPSSFSLNYVKYAHEVCWDKTFWTVYRNISRPERSEEFFWNVHKYIPMILIIFALLFYLTFSGWKMFCRFLGLDLDMLADTIGSQAGKISEYCFRKAVGQSSSQINQYLNPEKDRLKDCIGGLSFVNGRMMMTLSYICLKLDYLFTIAVVVVGTRLITHGNFLLLGFNVVYEYVVKDVNANKTTLFPENVLCDYTIHIMSSLHDYTVDCKLNVNSVLERLFLFMWAWFAFLVLVTVINMLIWLVRLWWYSYQPMHAITAKSSHGPGIFMRDVLKLDGRFLMMLLMKKQDPFTVAEIVNELYRLSDQGVLEQEASYNQSDKGGSYPKHPPMSLQPQPPSNAAQPIGKTPAGKNVYEIPTEGIPYTRDTIQAASSNI